METFNDIPVIPFEDGKSWEEWLAANYTLFNDRPMDQGC